MKRKTTIASKGYDEKIKVTIELTLPSEYGVKARMDKWSQRINSAVHKVLVDDGYAVDKLVFK